MAYTKKREEFTDTEIVRLAEELESRPEAEALKILEELPPEVAGQILEHMDHEISSGLISHLKRSEAAEILEEMAPDSAVDLMEDLSAAERAELLRRMEPPEAAVIEELIAYPHDSAGGLMSPEVVALPKELTVEEAIETLRRAANEAETIYYAYVVDQDRRLLGVLSMRDLIISDPHTPIEEIMRRDAVAVTAETDAEEVARLFDRYDFLALPVVDDANRLLGIVTVDDVIDSIREEATEDMHRMVGVGVDERVFSPLWSSVRRRLPWLYINLVTAFLAATVVGLFQGTIEKYVILAVFMPVIAGMGGNAGLQTVTILVRGIALGELKVGGGMRALFKEIRLGMLHGIAIGAVAAVVAYGVGGSPLLGLVVMLALFFNLTFACTAGTLIPLGLRALGLDPALASSIFLTMVTDVAGFFFLLGLGTLLLP